MNAYSVGVDHQFRSLINIYGYPVLYENHFQIEFKNVRIRKIAIYSNVVF